MSSNGFMIPRKPVPTLRVTTGTARTTPGRPPPEPPRSISPISSESSRNNVLHYSVENHSNHHTKPALTSSVAPISTNYHNFPSTYENFDNNNPESTWNAPAVIKPEISNHNGHRTPKTKRSTFVSLSNDWWLWEIFSGVLSILCLVAICVILTVYNHNPLPNLQWGITLNAIIALLATVMKAALLVVLTESTSQLKWISLAGPQKKSLVELDSYDGASRGGLGSVFFLWRHKKECWRDIVSLAAIFYIISIGVSTFAQQLIQSTNDRIADHSHDSRVFRSDSYSLFYQNNDNRGIAVPERLYSDMSAAVYNGFYGSEVATDTMFECAATNCTYPITPTLAVCSKCIDMSSELTKVENHSLSLGQWYYTLPNGPTLPEQSYFMNFSVTPYPNMTAHFKETLSLITSFRYMNLTEYVNGTNLAAECALYFCIQAWNVTAKQGILEKTVVQTWTDVVDNYVPSVAAWNEMYPHSVPSYLNLSIPDNRRYNFTNNTYGVFDKALWALQSILPPMFSGIVEYGTHGSASGEIYSQDTMERLYHASPDMSTMLSRIADSMTNSIRRTSPSIDTNDYLGTAYTQVAIVHVVWLWLIPPASLVLFSIIYLAYAILATRRIKKTSNIKVWKSSQLPMLYHGLDQQALLMLHRSGTRDALSTDEMRNHAEHVLVSFESGRDGLKLSTT